MRVLFGAFSLLMGAILGTFGGFAVYEWVDGTQPVCAVPSVGFEHAFSGCDKPSMAPFVIPGIVFGIVLVGLWTWWMQRTSTRG